MLTRCKVNLVQHIVMHVTQLRSFTYMEHSKTM